MDPYLKTKFYDRINRIQQILIFHFQFPGETENTQSLPRIKVEITT
jgi:hypothetical protein